MLIKRGDLSKVQVEEEVIKLNVVVWGFSPLIRGLRLE